MSLKTIGDNSLNAYRKFLDELHKPVMWSDDILFLASENDKKVMKCIHPLKMTKYKAKQKNLWWYGALLEIFYIAKNLEVVQDIIVHGSYGDFSTTAFSDIELTVLVDDSVFLDFRKKREFSKWVRKKLHKFIVKVDPLQHHGAFYVWSNISNEYSELILPCSAYDSCWSLTGSKLYFSITDDVEILKKESKIRLKDTLNRLSHPDRHFFRLGFNDYSLKRYLSNFMLVPTFYYQNRGSAINKKQSIDKFLNEFPGLFSEALLMATRFRDMWPNKSNILKILRPLIVSQKIPQGKLDILFLSFFFHRQLNKKFENQFLLHAKKGSVDFLELLDADL